MLVRTLMSLRVFLALMMAGAVTAAWGSDGNPAVRSGPMVGYGDMTEVMMWVQTDGPATVAYRYWTEGDRSRIRMSSPVRAVEENWFIARTMIDSLSPGTRYAYEVVLNGAVVARPYRLAFQTQPLWQWRTDPPDFSVAFGSCLYVNDTTWDRPGKPFGGDFRILGAIAAQRPDIMLWLGDNVYLREGDFGSAARIMERYAKARAYPELQPLLGASHNYAIWDDHDYGPNNADRTYPLRRESLEIFKLFWANPTYGTVETPGTFCRWAWGDVEFLLLDDRYHRSPNGMPDGPEVGMLGRGQLQWLKESLVSSRAPFKIIVNGGQMLPPNRFENFRSYRREYDELLSFIRSARVPGVMFITGDRHLTELSVISDSTFYPLYDYTSSPLTSGVASSLNELGDTLQVAGTFVNDRRNFGVMRFSGTRKDRQVVMECYDADGTKLWSRTVRASELVPPGM
jgi:alkaline phosphatase D